MLSSLNENTHASELSLLVTLFALSATSPVFLAGLPLMLVLDVVDDLVANH